VGAVKMVIRWGIIGCGNVSERKSGPAFNAIEGSVLQAVMRRTPELAKDYAQRHGVPVWYSDVDQLLADPTIDAVYIATPPGSHCSLALQACKAGKITYVEKPMARCYAECQQMVTAFEKANLPLFVAYYRRALPRFLRVKKLLAEQTIGQVSSITLRYCSQHFQHIPQPVPWRYKSEFAGGGLFLDLASHTLDIIDFLFGPMQAVAGEASQRVPGTDVEDTVALSFRSPDGIVGTGTWNFASFTNEDRIEITGTLGRIALSTFGDTPVEIHSAQGLSLFEERNPETIQQPLIQTIVQHLAGGEPCPSTGASAARTSWVMDQALLSYYGTREGDFWHQPRIRLIAKSRWEVYGQR
jgi:1,5-anhydro-D-fructose reductase (1,5-anhydro-D-mannitol-forming)